MRRALSHQAPRSALNIWWWLVVVVRSLAAAALVVTRLLAQP
jgi:hypothetical protein